MTQRTHATAVADERTGADARPGFPVVGIGASAGGLRALTAVLEQLPADGGMAYVVVLHLSPRHESSADKVLQRSTRMPVLQVGGEVRLEVNTVYVISPNHHLAMADGHLRVEPADRPAGPHVAIDLFFRTLAEVHRERAIGVVLSGTGSDGTAGLARIREHGGVTIAQAPDDAEYEDMPRNAIAAGVVDFVLPAVEVPERLLALRRAAERIVLPPSDEPDAPAHSRHGRPSEAAEHALADVLRVLAERTGHDFRHYKRATVLRRIERRMQVNGVTDLPTYRDHLLAHDAETTALLDDMLISVTGFFRDREAFETLEREVMPALFRDRPDDSPVRAWVAGCATGEEAYSVAMLLHEQAATLQRPPTFQVFATDIDARRWRWRAPAAIPPRSSPTCRRRAFASSSPPRAAATSSRRRCAIACCSRCTMRFATRRSRSSTWCAAATC